MQIFKKDKALPVAVGVVAILQFWRQCCYRVMSTTATVQGGGAKRICVSDVGKSERTPTNTSGKGRLYPVGEIQLWYTVNS